MDIRKRIDEIADGLTAGLESDPALRLDVRNEMASHLEDKIEETRQECETEEESVELAVKSFGSLPEIAEGLLQANRRRMTIHALIKWGIRVALVPAAIILVLFVVGGGFARLGNLFYAMEGNFMWSHGPDVGYPKNLSEDEALILYGDRSRDTESAGQKAIWEKHPESMVYYGNYISHLATEHDTDSTFFEKEVRRGIGLDPDNARYNLILVGNMLDRACELKRIDPVKKDSERTYELIIKDRDLLDEAFDEILKSKRKPHMKTYTREMLRKRLDILPTATRLTEQIRRIAMAAGCLLPDLLKHRQIERTAPPYADILISEGKKERAKEVLGLWYPLATRISDESFTLIEILVAFSVAKMSLSDQYQEIVKKLGEPGFAETQRIRAERIMAIHDGWREQKKKLQPTLEKELEESAGILTALLLPALGGDIPTEKELAPGRHLEYTLVEQSWALTLMLLMLFLMLAALVVVLRRRIGAGPDVRPLLILPSSKDLLRIFGMGVALPIAVFFLYTRISGLAGRHLSLSVNWCGLVLELLILGAVILYITTSMTADAVAARCHALGIAVPEEKSILRCYVFPILIGILGILWIVMVVFSRKYSRPMFSGGVGPVFLLMVIAGCILSSAPYFFVLLFGKKTLGQYYGTVARSLIPVFAGAVILVVLLTNPYLSCEETRLVQTDPVLAVGNKEYLGFTKLEADLVQRLKKEIKDTVKQIEAEE